MTKIVNPELTYNSFQRFEKEWVDIGLRGAIVQIRSIEDMLSHKRYYKEKSNSGGGSHIKHQSYKGQVSAYTQSCCGRIGKIQKVTSMHGTEGVRVYFHLLNGKKNSAGQDYEIWWFPWWAIRGIAENWKKGNPEPYHSTTKKEVAGYEVEIKRSNNSWEKFCTLHEQSMQDIIQDQGRMMIGTPYSPRAIFDEKQGHFISAPDDRVAATAAMSRLECRSVSDTPNIQNHSKKKSRKDRKSAILNNMTMED